jgi:adenosylhomocysteine nucleosidase
LNVVGVVCALAAEARQLGPATRRQALLSSLGDGTLLAVSGMGDAAASRGARALIDAGASALVSFGVAGGLDPALAAGTLLLPSEVAAVDGTAIATARRWREQLGAALAAHGPVACGRLLTSARAIGSVADKAALFRSTGAAAVDMESLSVAQAAATRRLPFIAVRAIVDTAADVLPRAVTAAADSAGRLRLWRLLGALALAPADLLTLIRLARCFRAASRSLAAVGRTGALAPLAFAVSPDTGTA